jgi:hypothetical protein
MDKLTNKEIEIAELAEAISAVARMRETTVRQMYRDSKRTVLFNASQKLTALTLELERKT